MTTPPPKPLTQAPAHLRDLPPLSSTVEHLHLLAGSSPVAARVELRLHNARTNRWSQHFPSAVDHTAVAQLARRYATTHDVYVGVLLRRRSGGRRRDLLQRGRVVWVDLDTPTASDALEDFPIRPSLIVASGTPGHRHVYWRLGDLVDLDEIEEINQVLARHLGGDPHATDASRILRLVGTRHHKAQPATNVELLDTGPAINIGHLRNALDLPVHPTTPPERQSSIAPTRRAHPGASTVRSIDGRSPIALLEAMHPADYVTALTGQDVPSHSRKIRCPLHEDDTPSLHVYETPEEGWCCYGCRRGGRVYDLAAALTNRSLRGRSFLDLQRDLVSLLIEHEVPSSPPPRR